MWDSIEVKVNGLTMNINEIKKLFFQTKGGISWSQFKKQYGQNDHDIMLVIKVDCHLNEGNV